MICMRSFDSHDKAVNEGAAVVAVPKMIGFIGENAAAGVIVPPDIAAAGDCGVIGVVVAVIDIPTSRLDRFVIADPFDANQLSIN